MTSFRPHQGDRLILRRKSLEAQHRAEYLGKPLAGAGQSFAMATLREGAYAAPACRDRACADRAIGADRHQGLCGVRRALLL